MKIVSIEHLQESHLRYDLEIVGIHNFVAEGIVVHNSNLRFCYSQGELLVGSHRQAKKYGSNIYWKAVEQVDPDTRTSALAGAVLAPGYIFFGEVYGRVQDLRYGLDGVKLVVFDTFSLIDRYYLNYDHLKHLCSTLGMPMVPELYRGPWKPELISLAEGMTTLPSAKGCHMREGFVVKPVEERWNQETGRTILKAISKDYKLRKVGTEGH